MLRATLVRRASRREPTLRKGLICQRELWITLARKRFRAKWTPVRVKKTRQARKLYPPPNRFVTSRAIRLPSSR